MFQVCSVFIVLCQLIFSYNSMIDCRSELQFFFSLGVVFFVGVYRCLMLFEECNTPALRLTNCCTQMSQFLEWLSQKIITACKNKPYGWGRVLPTPAAISVENFINDFHFQSSLKNHSIQNCPIKGDKVTAVKRSIFLWLGEHSRQMEDLIKG